MGAQHDDAFEPEAPLADGAAELGIITTFSSSSLRDERAVDVGALSIEGGGMSVARVDAMDN
jgi:hypothetical protein